MNKPFMWWLDCFILVGLVDGVAVLPLLVCLLDDGLLVRNGSVELVDGVAVLLSLVCLLDDGLLVWHGFLELVEHMFTIIGTCSK